MLSKDSHSKCFFSHHNNLLRVFFFEVDGSEHRDPQQTNMQIIKDCIALSSKVDIYDSASLSKAQRSLEKRSRKIVEGQKQWMITVKQCLLGISE